MTTFEIISTLIKTLSLIYDMYKMTEKMNDIEKNISNNCIKKIWNRIILFVNPNNFMYLSEDNKILLALIYLQTYIENNELHLRNDINIVTSGQLFQFISNINIPKRHFYIDSLVTRTDVNYFNVKISKTFKISLEKYIYINKFYLKQLMNEQ